jgi:hypothetical protein
MVVGAPRSYHTPRAATLAPGPQSDAAHSETLDQPRFLVDIFLSDAPPRSFMNAHSMQALQARKSTQKSTCRLWGIESQNGEQAPTHLTASTQSASPRKRLVYCRAQQFLLYCGRSGVLYNLVPLV